MRLFARWVLVLPPVHTNANGPGLGPSRDGIGGAGCPGYAGDASERSAPATQRYVNRGARKPRPAALIGVAAAFEPDPRTPDQ